MVEINVAHYYENENDEDNRLNRTKADSIEFLTTFKYIVGLSTPAAHILDACAGTGVYAFPLAEMGYQVTAGDLVEFNVDILLKKQSETPILKHIYTGSILSLPMLQAESYDVVLNLGSFYHLRSHSERLQSIQESLRVLKPGGYYFLAYLNKHSNYVKFNKMMKDDFSIFEDYVKNGYNRESDVFFATTPEEVEEFMLGQQLELTNHVATDGLKFLLKDTINSFDDNEFNRFMKIHYESCEIKSLLGYSEHALYIGKKL